MKNSFTAGLLAHLNTSLNACRLGKLKQTTHQASSRWLQWCPQKRSPPSRAPRLLHLQQRARWCAARVARGHVRPAIQYSRHPWAHTAVLEGQALCADPNPSATRTTKGQGSDARMCRTAGARSCVRCVPCRAASSERSSLIQRLDEGAQLHRTFEQPKPRGQVPCLPSLRSCPFSQPMRRQTNRARAIGGGHEPVPAAEHGYTVLSRGTPPLPGSSPVPCAASGNMHNHAAAAKPVGGSARFEIGQIHTSWVRNCGSLTVRLYYSRHVHHGR